MNPATIHAAIQSAHKKFPHNSRKTRRISDYSSTREYGNVTLSQSADWAGRGNPVELGASSAHHPALFAVGRFMAADSGQRSRWPVLVPVFHPAVSPPPFAVESEAADSTITRSPIMSAISQGDNRPFSDRIESALILSEAASATLEKNPTDEAIETAAHTLIRAGVGLLSIAPTMYLIDDLEHACVISSLVTVKAALAHLYENGDLPEGADAIIGLTLAELERTIDRFDIVNLTGVEIGREGGGNG